MNVRAIEARAEKTELAGTRRGTIVELLTSGEIAVRLDGEVGPTACDFLETTSGAPPLLRVGDPVVVLVPDDADARPAVVGKIGGYKLPDRRQVVLEADEELTVRCGEAAITFRDGKILIKGVDIVSHAGRRNRIRGGSVQIN